MSRDVPERGRLTDDLITYLAGNAAITAQSLLIGDADVPSGGGWPGGQRTQAAFVATTTVRTGTAVPLHRETVRARHTFWRCRYELTTVGGVRSQADAGADVVRHVMISYQDRVITGSVTSRDWNVTDVVYESLGAVTKRGSDDSATWQVVDTVDIWLVRAAP